MYSNKKVLNLSVSEDKIRKVGLKNLHLLGKDQIRFKFTSPKKSVLKKSLNNAKFLFYLKSPKSPFNSKIKYTPAISNLSNSYSQSKDSKLNSKNKTYYFQKNKQNLFTKNLLLSKNINVFTPKINGFELGDKTTYIKQSDKYNNEKMIKNSFSNNYKVTNSSSFFNMNVILNKTTTSMKSNKINLKQIIQGYKKEKNQNLEGYDYLDVKNEKNIFEKKLKRKKEEEISKGNILYENRKKYPFVRTSNYFNFRKSKKIPESISKINKKLCQILLKENNSIFHHPINIIKKGKFSKKFENPRDIEINQHKEDYYKIKDIHIGEYILKEAELVKQENEKINEKDRKKILNKFKNKIMQIYLINKNIMIPMSEIIKKYKISNHIFNFDQTRHLNYFIKIKDLNKALSILSNYHHIVLDIDQFYMTPLHYAAKYNFYQIIPHLMSYGAYVDAETSFGVTPLILCLKKNYCESMILLFLHMANPFVKFNKISNIKDKNIDYNTKNIVERIKLIHIKNRLHRDKNYYTSVKSDIYDFVVNECKGLFEYDFINLVKINYKIE